MYNFPAFLQTLSPPANLGKKSGQHIHHPKQYIPLLTHQSYDYIRDSIHQGDTILLTTLNRLIPLYLPHSRLSPFFLYTGVLLHQCGSQSTGTLSFFHSIQHTFDVHSAATVYPPYLIFSPHTQYLSGSFSHLHLLHVCFCLPLSENFPPSSIASVFHSVVIRCFVLRNLVNQIF